MLILPQSVYNQLRFCGEAAYPEECCGILVGISEGATRTATSAIPAKNASPAPRNRYQIEPRDLVRILLEAQDVGREILGFYHSHPDHPAHWSPTDLMEAHWLGSSYVITSVEKGTATVTNAFCLAGATEEDKRFEPEEIEIVGKEDQPGEGG